MKMGGYFVLVAVIALLGVACGGSDAKSADEQILDDLMGTLPNVEELFVFGNELADGDVLTLAVHGGPAPVLLTEDFEYLEEGGVPIAYVRQYQMVFPDCIGFEVNQNDLGYHDAVGLPEDTGHISTERSHECFLGSVAILRTIVEHFQEMGVELNLIGHSYGSLVSNKYLATYTSADFKKVVLGGVRFEMPQLVVDTFHDGGFANFDNGVEPVIHFRSIDDFPPGEVALNFPSFTAEIENVQSQINFENTSISGQANTRLLSSGARERYTATFSQLDLTNVTVFSGLIDTNVGRLTDTEAAVLRDSGATVNLVDDNHGLVSANADIIAILQS